ncbi:MAG: acyl-CoA reductase [Bacteroidales bacterium]
MNIDKRINAFAALGSRIISEINQNDKSDLSIAIDNANIHNPWFTPENVRNALSAIAQQWLSKETLENWIAQYPKEKLTPANLKQIGVIMAGNIPLVGFHDLLCVLMSGHRFIGKFSSKDGNLMQIITQMLIAIEPEFANYIEITENQLKGFDAVIATGSDNTSRYFDYYFKNYPSIIRKHRNSIAVITGNESDDDFVQLSNDIFTYFGLGCRNVSKILVPKEYNFKPMLDNFSKWSSLVNQNKYANNYEYNRAIYTMNQVQHLDTGYLIVTPSESIESPVGVLYYQEYNKLNDVTEYLNVNSEKIQCIVGESNVHLHAIPFGTTQSPKINDYADGIDTIEFLSSL